MTINIRRKKTVINIDVAVAVIHYGDQYLLGFRKPEQHQGNRYEFIGGKIEDNETAKQALIREVLEEIGLDISARCLINPLGILRHHYANIETPHKSKRVCLHVFRVELTEQHYLECRDQQQGCEGQQLQWVSLEDLVANKYRLPEANKTILQWLKLPDLISITQDIDSNLELMTEAKSRAAADNAIDIDIDMNASVNISTNTTNESRRKQWLYWYKQKLPLQACIYMRLKNSDLPQREQLLISLLANRPDIMLIIDCQLANHLYSKNTLPPQVIAQHLTQKVIDETSQEANLTDVCNNLLAGLPLTVSSHNQETVLKVNQLVQYRLKHDLSPVIGVFVSPVQQTATHPKAVPLRWEGFERIASVSEVPVIALGGMSPEDLQQVKHHQGDKVAGIRKFLT